jgi:cold shock CspA family protein
MNKMFGKVHVYYEEKGYGFISIAFNKRVFFHVSHYRGEVVPTAGLSVEFDLAPSIKPGKPDQAIHVIPAETTGRTR